MITVFRRSLIRSLGLAASLCFGGEAFAQAPAFSSVSPMTGPERRNVTITGTNFFGGSVTTRTLRLNSFVVQIQSVSSSRIVFTVPVGATTGPISYETNLGSATTATNFVVAADAPPANDNFASALAMPGAPSGVVTGNTANATKELSEPNHAGVVGGASVWYTWTAPSSGLFLFNPHDSSATNFGVTLAIYTGSTLGSLTPVASASAGISTSRYQSAVTLNATAGVTYYVAIDGYTGIMGDYKLTWSPLTPPIIASFLPASGYAGQSFSIGGSGFVLGSQVTVGGVPVSQARISVVSPTTISVTQIPGAAAIGPGPVTVTTPAGGVASTVLFNVLSPPPPSITSFTPASGAAGTTVSLTGIALSLGDTPVKILFSGGIYANPVTVTNSTTISAKVPSGAITGPITVQTNAGAGTSSTSFTVTSSFVPPVILSMFPSSGGPGTTVFINGQNLFGSTAVLFNGVSASFTADPYGGMITATVPPGATTGPVTVENPAGSATSATAFVVTQVPPTIASFSPATISSGQAVVITGAGFNYVTGVDFNGVAAASFTVDSATQITAIVPVGPLVNGPINVATAVGLATSAASFTYFVPPPVPMITGFSPAAIAPGLAVTITGANFTGATSVRFNGVSGSFTVNSSTQIRATAPSSSLTAGPITVTTANGTATSATDYTVTLQPIITGISTPSGPEKRVITVFGANFSGPGITGPTARFNGMPVGAFSVSANSITFAVPAGASTGPITVQTSQGSATSLFNFTVTMGPPPANDNFVSAQLLTGISGVMNGNIANATKEPGEPNHAGNPGGASVWFTWMAPQSGLFLFNPYNSSSSQFGIIQTIYTGTDVTSLTPVASGFTPTNAFARYGSAAVLNAVAGTTYRIALDGYNGTMPDYRLSWAPLLPPVVAGFTPTGGAAGQTVAVSVNGNNFTPGAPVSFGGGLADPSRTTYQSPTLITVSQIPVTAVTGPITVTTPAGTASSSAIFTVTPPPAPTITSFTPLEEKVGGSVTITGTNFAGTSAVRFNGVAATSFTVSGNGQTITTTVPVGSSTGPLTVTTPGGTATSAAPFLVIAPPEIVQQPQSQTATFGQSVSFTIAATSNAPAEYLWRKNGAGLILTNPTAGTATLVISQATMADAGTYDCQVANYAGSVFSVPVTLTVNKAAATIALSGSPVVYDGSPKVVTATTNPAGLAVQLTYNGSGLAPTNAGTYAVAAEIVDPNYSGFATGTLVISKAPATIALANLVQPYNGQPRPVTVTTSPADLNVNLTYHGSATAPSNPGSFAVVATIADANHSGTASALLVITIPALVRHAPSLNGGLDGSLQVLLAEDVKLNGNAYISGDLLVPGTPTLRLNGHPTFVGTRDGTGNASPSNYQVTLNGGVLLRYLVRRTDAIAMPNVATPPSPTGTRDVAINSAGQSPGDFATLRNLTLNGNVGQVTVPAGTYGNLTANGNSGFTLGVAGATTPAIYHLQNLTMNGSSRLQIAGPVVLNLAHGVSINGQVGEAAHPEWVTLNVASGGVTLNGNVTLHGYVAAPNGTVAINDSSTLHGGVACDRLTINGNGLLDGIE
jgi:hypothetical protein